MYRKLSQIILSIFFIASGFFFVEVSDVHALCVVTSANFRPSPSPINPNNWFNDDTRPYVYIDVQTTGCQLGTDSFELSITESDSAAGTSDGNLDDDVNGLDLTGQGFLGLFCNTSATYCIDNKPILVEQNQFTLAARAGEDECEQLDPDWGSNGWSPFHCIYYLRINDAVLNSATNIGSVSNIRYNCHGLTCDENWTWINTPTSLPFGALHPNDPANPDNPSPGGGSSDATVGTTEVEINIQNPIGDNTMTLYDFIKKVIDFAIKIGIPIVAIAIIYSGLLFVTARGNDKQLETAKNAFTYAVIGGAILLGAWIFAQLIKDTIESITMVISYFA